MNRQQRRVELRRLKKEHKGLTQSKVFKDVLFSPKFKNLSKEDITLLKEKKHTNDKLQYKFNLGNIIIMRIKHLEERIAFLKEKRDLVENV